MVEQIDRENEALQEWAEEGRRMERGITEAVAAERARILAAMRQPDAAMVEAVAKAIWGDDPPGANEHWHAFEKEATAALSAAADHMEAGQ